MTKKTTLFELNKLNNVILFFLTNKPKTSPIFCGTDEIIPNLAWKSLFQLFLLQIACFALFDLLFLWINGFNGGKMAFFKKLAGIAVARSLLLFAGTSFQRHGGCLYLRS